MAKEYQDILKNVQIPNKPIDMDDHIFEALNYISENNDILQGGKQPVQPKKVKKKINKFFDNKFFNKIHYFNIDKNLEDEEFKKKYEQYLSTKKTLTKQEAERKKRLFSYNIEPTRLETKISKLFSYNIEPTILETKNNNKASKNLETMKSNVRDR